MHEVWLLSAKLPTGQATQALPLQIVYLLHLKHFPSTKTGLLAGQLHTCSFSLYAKGLLQALQVFKSEFQTDGALQLMHFPW